MEVIDGDIEYAKIILEDLFKIPYISNDVIKLASKIYSQLCRRGELIPSPDVIVASICIVNEIPLATYDQHFKRLINFELKLRNSIQVISELKRRQDSNKLGD